MKRWRLLLVIGIMALSLCACSGNGVQEEESLPPVQAEQEASTGSEDSGDLAESELPPVQIEPQTPPEEEKERIEYDPVLDHWPEMLEMAEPEFSLTEIQEMVSSNLSLDEVADKISTLADLVQYLHQKGFSSDSGDIQFEYGGYSWSVNRSAQTVFENNKGNCGGGSNLINYILRGDFDEQGYVGESGNAGGHIYNYFKQDGIYYFFDFTNLYFNGEPLPYRIYATEDPQEYAAYYIGSNHIRIAPEEQAYLLFQFMYEFEGDHQPKGWGKERTPLDFPYCNVLPKQLEEVTTILFVEEGMSGAVFVGAPDRSHWPELAQ